MAGGIFEQYDWPKERIYTLNSCRTAQQILDSARDAEGGWCDGLISFEILSFSATKETE